ncbi:villin-4-like [Pyrus ussuriensis x Pyrus communis]|uniref:Villin-4-like n=1 Tax=Pyrus ussuriensis x Pyrus communis TaxID=2448454 RepID=A0A5N5FUG2_9ROSA|nr:villin-4-like [Pyrus ussuriensis x Pyrus communis]
MGKYDKISSFLGTPFLISHFLFGFGDDGFEVGDEVGWVWTSLVRRFRPPPPYPKERRLVRLMMTRRRRGGRCRCCWMKDCG